MDWNLFILPILVSLVLFSGCAQPKQETIKVGGAFALTGDAATWGIDERKAVELAFAETNAAGGVNGKQLELLIEDTQADSMATATAIQKLIQVDQVKAIIGPTWGDSFGSIVGPIGEQAGVVQITPSGALEVVEFDNIDFPYYYSTWYPQLPEAEKHAEFIKKQGWKSIVIIHDQDPFNSMFSQTYQQEMEKNGIQVLQKLEVDIDEKDFRTVLTKAKSYDPNAIFVSIFQVGSLGNILRNMQELGLDVPLLATASAQTPTLLQSFASEAEAKMFYSFPDSSSDSYQLFEQKFTQKFGAVPQGPSAGTAYDAARVVIYALEQGAKSGDEIKSVLDRIDIPGTVVDKISFTPNGQIEKAPFVIKTVKDGAFVVFSD